MALLSEASLKRLRAEKAERERQKEIAAKEAEAFAEAEYARGLEEGRKAANEMSLDQLEAVGRIADRKREEAADPNFYKGGNVASAAMMLTDWKAKRWPSRVIGGQHSESSPHDRYRDGFFDGAAEVWREYQQLEQLSTPSK